MPGPKAAELATQAWDAVVVGGGHNGLTAAAYLARAGRSVLVLERRDQVGGACTLERPFSDPRFVISPCAYLVGLLHPLVIEELALARYGYRTFVCDPTQWTPFEDGSSLTQWLDEDRTAKEIHALAPGDVDGYVAYVELFRRIRSRLRAGGDPARDTWIGDAPDRAALEELFADDPEAREVLFEASIADVVERHVRDERLRIALHGQGIIGTYAGPRDPGTAWIHAMHSLGPHRRLELRRGRHGPDLVLPRRRRPGRRRRGRHRRCRWPRSCRARASASKAARSCGPAPSSRTRIPSAPSRCATATCRTRSASRVDAWRCESPVVKVNCALSRLPTFTAAPDRPDHVYRAQVEIARGIDDTQSAYEACRRGEPAPEWCEIYFQTAYDPTVAPPGADTMSVFAQYAPYTLADGTWATRRDEIGDRVLDAIARFAPDVADCVLEREVLGPPDVESRVGLTGGHIFQGECLPDQMWDRRFAPRTSVAGLYLCGAATHPGGSVIGVNGRNAARAVLADRADGA